VLGLEEVCFWGVTRVTHEVLPVVSSVDSARYRGGSLFSTEVVKNRSPRSSCSAPVRVRCGRRNVCLAEHPLRKVVTDNLDNFSNRGDSRRLSTLRPHKMRLRSLFPLLRRSPALRLSRLPKLSVTEEATRASNVERGMTKPGHLVVPPAYGKARHLA
jgi:hypothetical protein